MRSLSRVQLFATPWTVAYLAPPSVGFSRQEYWSGLPIPSQGDLPNPGIKPGSPALQADCLPSEPPTRPGADCGSDHELLIAKFRLKLEKVGKTARPLRYDLNQIPYDYTVEVRNRFKGLDLIDRVPDELWTEVHDIVQETGIKNIPLEKKCKKQNACLGRPYK